MALEAFSSIVKRAHLSGEQGISEWLFARKRADKSARWVDGVAVKTSSGTRAVRPVERQAASSLERLTASLSLELHQLLEPRRHEQAAFGRAVLGV